ncbi:MAG: YebC/PmpR family DNA-binding transcriptional regulator [Planctomycetes bacterium]|nr:YebC/PmpR family DNA-binding transcriptional regulator [Planctomycetota bacterium]
MAGHSHWARIKRAKSVTDARRGRLWSKLARAVIVAARSGGGDPEANLSLRYAIDAAKAENMPKDTIDRAIKKGTGELGSVSYEELVYEGYGPGGAAILCRTLTDNRNRTAPEIKRILEGRGGKLGSSNCVAWMFSQRGVIVVAQTETDEDTLTNIALEHGADDLESAGDAFELSCDPDAFEALRQALADANIKIESAEISMLPSSTVTLKGQQAERMLKLIETLEDHDDVQQVYSNFEISEADLARLTE